VIRKRASFCLLALLLGIRHLLSIALAGTAALRFELRLNPTVASPNLNADYLTCDATNPLRQTCHSTATSPKTPRT
jgi:hypothetical protein